MLNLTKNTYNTLTKCHFQLIFFKKKKKNLILILIFFKKKKKVFGGALRDTQAWANFGGGLRATPQARFLF
jgi:hypothetical protein